MRYSWNGFASQKHKVYITCTECQTEVCTNTSEDCDDSGVFVVICRKCNNKK